MQELILTIHKLRNDIAKLQKNIISYNKHQPIHTKLNYSIHRWNQYYQSHSKPKKQLSILSSKQLISKNQLNPSSSFTAKKQVSFSTSIQEVSFHSYKPTNYHQSTHNIPLIYKHRIRIRKIKKQQISTQNYPYLTYNHINIHTNITNHNSIPATNPSNYVLVAVKAIKDSTQQVNITSNYTNNTPLINKHNININSIINSYIFNQSYIDNFDAYYYNLQLLNYITYYYETVNSNNRRRVFNKT